MTPMSAETTCPFCNALLPPAPGGKAPCPRCGETVSVRDTAADNTPRPTSPADAPTPYRKPVDANRRTAIVILSVMLVSAALGLAYALNTVDWRRTNDKGITRTSRRPFLPSLTPWVDQEPSAPARLAALAYMPEGTTLVAGLHANEILSGPLGEMIKARAIKVANVEVSLDSAEKLLGIPAGNIAHMAAGAVLEKGGEVNLTPPSVLVIRTREPVGLNRLREALQAKSPKEVGGRPVSEAKLAGFPVILWVPLQNVVVVGAFTDLSDIPVRPAEGLERLVPELRSAVEERLAAGTLAWAVAHSRDWTKSPYLAALPLSKALPLADLAGVRTLAAWVPSGAPLRAQAAVRCDGEATARRLEAELEKKKDARIKHGREGEWLSLQITLGE